MKNIGYNTPNLTPSEKITMDAILKAMAEVEKMGGEEPHGLQANHTELVQAIHVLQGFVKQHVLHRIRPNEWANWYKNV